MSDTHLVHVIDDDDAVRDSIAFLLEAAGFEVKTYDSGTRFLEQFTGQETGCVLTDVRMPGLTGLELAVKLRALGSGLPIVVITGHADVALAVEAMKAGVEDFIEKPFDDVVLVKSVESALARSGTAGNDPARSAGERAETLRRVDKLSMRERQVLQALVEGRANKVMARDLGISPRTVEIYRANVMSKMGAASLSQLVRMTILAGVSA
ncbi:MAG TPA: response regulator FixJ [Caulobacteraceae bacterium]|jgi:two-component system response regulator FixJ